MDDGAVIVEPSEVPKTETIFAVLAGLAIVVALKRFKWLRFVGPWVARSMFNRFFYGAQRPEA